jgi:hypothetical protein
MISLATILHRTPARIHRNSQSCRARITSSVMNADERGAFYLVKGIAMDANTTRKNYRQVAKVYLDKSNKVPLNPKIFIWCGCSWFKYHCEVALAIRGSSYIVSSNGALPKITNPTARPQVCKHALAFLKVIRSQPMKIETKSAKSPQQVRAALKEGSNIDKIERRGQSTVAKANAARQSGDFDDSVQRINM